MGNPFLDSLKGKSKPRTVKKITMPDELKPLASRSYVQGVTGNGAKTNATTDSKLVDLFFQIGSMRKVDVKTRAAEFIEAYNADPLLALKMLFYARDVRGGQGERETFRVMFRTLCLTDIQVAALNLHLVPIYGRWDDLFVTQGTRLESNAVKLWADAILAKDGLACKWAPREKSARSDWARRLRRQLGWSPKQYRKWLADNSTTVEQYMCDKNWDEINYSHVPAQAMSRLRKAFQRNDGTRFSEFKGQVKVGKAKINAGTAIHPHEILGKMRTGGGWSYAARYSYDETLELQWNALKDFAKGKGGNALVVCDVSGSMSTKLPESTIQCVDVAIAVGIYCGERIDGPFANHVLTFDNNSKLFSFEGKTTLADKANHLASAPWGGSTNLQAAFDAVLAAALRWGLKQDQIPETLIVVSDMEFNSTGRRTNFDAAAQKFARAGYKLPNIVWWNVNARPGNNPVKKDTMDTALVSGFSPSILAQVLEAEQMTPEKIMLNTLNKPRYEAVRVK